uniref:NADH dehydrogenase subunit 4L n=1 Tax=Heliconema longissimum TaxID=657295 RepID=G4V231_9BILA|nr:NADH dehydrogenase subunit 4L [Heliconema longissimum]ACV96730.1 NADH dehydrogenase subunit 4L [Heliconema longissimum]
MFFYLVSLLMFFFKFNRLIFLLLGLEMLALGLFLYFSMFFNFICFFYFLVFVVISSVTGLFVFICSLKSYGSDCSFL